MTMWSSETLAKRIPTEGLIEPYNSDRVRHAAYELALGPEAFITSDPSGRKQKLDHGAQLIIPPGQFGHLLTEEVIRMPNDAMGFISIRAGIKFRGLVNVSGFHVDPGFIGGLKFSVYNAGSQNIILSRGERVFLIWFNELDRPTADLYTRNKIGPNEISSQDTMLIQGTLASPSALLHQINELRTDHEKRLGKLDHSLAILWTLAIGLFIGGALLAYSAVG